MSERDESEKTVQAVDEHFAYKFADVAIFHILSLFSFSFALLLLLSLAVSIIAPPSKGNVGLTEPLASPGEILILLVFSLLFSSAYPSFQVSDSGLKVQVLLFWRILVPWENVREIRSTLLGFSKLVVLRRLTPLHRVYGLIFGLTTQPAFVIRRCLIDYDRAVKTIEEHIAIR